MTAAPPVHSLKRLFEKSLRKYADRTALHFEGESVTYRDLDRRSSAVANQFVERGVSVGEPIALLLPNSLAYVVVDLALFKAGAARFALNDMLSADEVRYMLTDTGAETVVVGEGFQDRFAAVRDDVDTVERLYAVTDDEASAPDGAVHYDDLLSAGDPTTTPDVAVGPDDRALHAYTGGTTGKPKGLVHTNRGMTANMYTTMMELDVTGDDRQLLTTPLPHSAGGFLWAGLLTGAEAWLHRGFDAGDALRRIEAEGITWAFVVPTMVYRLLDHDELAERDTGSLETMVYGAAPMTSARLREGIDAFGDVFCQFYGQGECPNFITTLPKKEHRLAIETGNEKRLGSAGQPCLMTEVRVVDPDTGEPVPQGESGEITVTAPYVMREYYRRPEATAETLVDGWVRTGDIGRIDEDGYLYLLDRKDDMIVTGGMNVYSTEVEEAIATHDGVKEVAVIGVPDEDWGEAVTAVVVPYEDADVAGAALKDLAGDRLAGYKKPKRVEFRDSLPRTPYDKVDKVALREPYWEDEERSIS
jgi:fatty-acyl-CoA synthase/long-chain acyl-CoA synthetase